MTPKTEQMAVAWVRKTLSPTSPPDKVFKHNFMREFLKQLKQENPSSRLLGPIHPKLPKKHRAPIGNPQVTATAQAKKSTSERSEAFIETEKAKKEALTKEVKKQQAEERKVKRLENKEKYGYAEVDGQRLEIANWTSEPSCLFAGRGDHPQRGKWKEGPSQEDIILNLPPDKNGNL